MTDDLRGDLIKQAMEDLALDYPTAAAAVRSWLIDAVEPVSIIVSSDAYSWHAVALHWWQRPGWWVRTRLTSLRYWWEDR